MLTHLLDTSVYCQPLKPRPLPAVLARWKAVGDANLATSVIADAEVLYGVLLKGSRKLSAAYDRVLRGQLPVLAIDLRVGDAFAQLKAEQHLKGQRRPDLDLLIAATARAHGLVVATLNARHFAGLDGVIVEDWSVPLP